MPLPRRPTVDPEAYRLYLEGLHFWHKRDTESIRKAVGLFRQAVDRTPLYAPAWAGLADGYEMLSGSVLSHDQGVRLARAQRTARAVVSRESRDSRRLVLQPD